MQNSSVKKQTVKFVEEKGRTTKEKIEKTFTDELIIGICSPIGSIRKEVILSLEKRLRVDYKYDVEIIKLSDFISTYYKEDVVYQEKRTGEFSELMHKIKGGDFLRRKYENSSILVELAIKKIREDREEIKTQDIKGRRKCYIIDSLKNTEELKLIRAVYREIFYLFSIFSPEHERVETLVRKKLSEPEAQHIITTDEFEDILHGQNVRNTFVEGDFFVRISNSNKREIDLKIKKFIHLIFSSDIITPNYQETAMFHAKSAAGNSACLSRQVGATITDKYGVSIARGWNDPPKFGGNLYRDTDDKPKRCKDIGYCHNIKHRNDIIDEITNDIKGILSSVQEEIKDTKLKIVKDNGITVEKIEEIIKKSKFKDIIEYSRSIHAEMHAIIIGSQLTGNKMVDGSLFCTTYPCHNCARHIVLAGIKNIYYIEPYKKSLGILLHNDSLTEDEKDTTKVRILPYDGVAPRRYLDFFSMNSDVRKDEEGKVKIYVLKDAVPKKRLSLQAIPTLENQAIHSLYECGLIEKGDEKENEKDKIE